MNCVAAFVLLLVTTTAFTISLGRQTRGEAKLDLVAQRLSLMHDHAVGDRYDYLKTSAPEVIEIAGAQ
jgi:hypothetical protein